MGVVIEVLQWYNTFVVNTSFISLVFIKLLSYIFPIEIYNSSKNLIRWLIVFSGFTNIIYIIYDAINSDEISFISRATGPYAAVYWIMIIVSCLLPFTLLINKVKDKGWAIFVISVVISAGWFFEQFVIKTTSNHMDYQGTSGSGWLISFLPIDILINGVVQGVLITGTSIIIVKYRNATINKA